MHSIYANMAAARYSSCTQETKQNKQIKEKKETIWGKVHQEIEESPYCARAGKLVKVLHCKKCYLYGKNLFEPFCCTGEKNDLCYDCYKKNISHYLGYPIYDVLEYDRAFIKFYLNIELAYSVTKKRGGGGKPFF